MEGIPKLANYVKTERIRLARHPQLNEAWLQNIIAEDPRLLGLGNTTVIDRERRQEQGGRLDLLLADYEGDIRYEVELQLGATDESHIIRCIEYWDIERRRYPAYEHVAVLVAEDVTSRFLNVLQLFSGTIPLVVLQATALQVQDKVTLTFTKVLDQRLLREDDESENNSPAADRSFWEKRASQETLAMTDALLQLVNEHSANTYTLNYTKNYIGLTDGFRNNAFVAFRPRKTRFELRLKVSDNEKWMSRPESENLAANVYRGKFRVNLRPDEFHENRPFLEEVVLDVVRTHLN